MAKREYEKPSVTVDCVELKHGPEGRTEVLLIQRTKDPFAGKWALPGGFVNKDEPLHIAAQRELREETGLRVTKLRQLGAFGDSGRDPRGWTISIAYLAELPDRRYRIKGADDANEARWFPVDALPALAFDHARILQLALVAAGLSHGTVKRL